MSGIALVTGGGGHVGTNLIRSLVEDGSKVRVVDSREPTAALSLGAEWVAADVRDEEAMRTACQGTAVVYHLASVISTIGGMGGLVESVNVDGARSVARAALSAGVSRLVHVSSAHAFDLLSQIGRTVDESSPRATDRRLPVYDRTKARGEQEVLRLVDQGLQAVSINPTGIIGPRDDVPSRMGMVLLQIWQGRLRTVTPGGFDWVDVRDVVLALRAAAERGRAGQSYIIGGHRHTARELVDLAAAAAGTTLRCRTLPAWATRAVAPVATVVARRTNNHALPTTEALAALAAFPRISCAKAERELGHRPRPISETLSDLREQYIADGRLPA